MRKQDSIIISLCAAAALMAAVYLVNPPGPRYYPLEGAWRMETVAGEPSMGWYSRVVYAVAAGAVSGLLARLWTRTQRPGAVEAGAPRALAGAAYVALGSLLLAAAGIVAVELLHVLDP